MHRQPMVWKNPKKIYKENFDTHEQYEGDYLIVCTKRNSKIITEQLR